MTCDPNIKLIMFRTIGFIDFLWLVLNTFVIFYLFVLFTFSLQSVSPLLTLKYFTRITFSDVLKRCTESIPLIGSNMIDHIMYNSFDILYLFNSSNLYSVLVQSVFSTTVHLHGITWRVIITAVRTFIISISDHTKTVRTISKRTCGREEAAWEFTV